MSQSHYLSTYLWYITDLAKFKGLLIKIKVIKGFSAKLKVLKDCNQIKVLKGYKGSTRGPVIFFLCIWPNGPLSRK